MPRTGTTHLYCANQAKQISNVSRPEHAGSVFPMSVNSLVATSQAGALGLDAPPLGARSAVSSRRGLLGVAGLLVTVLAVCLSAGQTNVLLPNSVGPTVPKFLAGPFGSAGLDLGLGGLIATLVLMFASYIVAMGAIEQLSGRVVLISTAALLALVLLAPPLLSTDIFSYDAYGRMSALYGANPYVHGPSWIPWDRVSGLIGAQWSNIPTVYGPLFTALSYVLAPLSIAASVVAYKSVAALSSLVIVAVVWKGARLRGLDPVKAVALVGLNPIIVVYGVGGGHNDLLMLALLMTGVYALLRQRGRTGGALMVTAIAVKMTAGLMLPFALADGTHRRNGARADQSEDARRRRRIIAGAGMAAAVMGALGFALFGLGPLHLADTLSKTQNQGNLQSIPRLISTLLGFGRLAATAELALVAGFMASLLWLLWRVWIGKLDWITGAGWATVSLLITAGSLLPWYVAWLVPIAALSSDRRLRVAAILMTGIGLTSI